MKKLIGTKTIENLTAAFLGELCAIRNYQEFSKIAENENNLIVKKVYDETIVNEQEHSNIFLNNLKKFGAEKYKVKIDMNLAKIGNVKENLKTSVNGETEESKVLYPKFAEIAKNEGFNQIFLIFQQISKIESYHATRFLKLLKLVESGKIYKNDKIVMYKCSRCGYIHLQKSAPIKCPVCFAEQKFFTVISESDF